MAEGFLDSLEKRLALAAACVIACLTVGVIRSFTLLFAASMARYGSTREMSSIPYILPYTVKNLTSPIVGYLGSRFGIKPVFTFGSVLSAACLCASFFAEEIIHVIILVGVGYGIGFGMGTTLVPQALSYHFEQHTDKANGFYQGGGCVGTFGLTAITDLLLNRYGLSGTFLILGGLCLNIIPAALLLGSRRSQKITKSTAVFSDGPSPSLACEPQDPIAVRNPLSAVQKVQTETYRKHLQGTEGSTKDQTADCPGTKPNGFAGSYCAENPLDTLGDVGAGGNLEVENRTLTTTKEPVIQNTFVASMPQETKQKPQHTPLTSSFLEDYLESSSCVVRERNSKVDVQSLYSSENPLDILGGESGEAKLVIETRTIKGKTPDGPNTLLASNDQGTQEIVLKPQQSSKTENFVRVQPESSLCAIGSGNRMTNAVSDDSVENLLQTDSAEGAKNERADADLKASEINLKRETLAGQNTSLGLNHRSTREIMLKQEHITPNRSFDGTHSKSRLSVKGNRNGTTDAQSGAGNPKDIYMVKGVNVGCGDAKFEGTKGTFLSIEGSENGKVIAQNGASDRVKDCIKKAASGIEVKKPPSISELFKVFLDPVFVLINLTNGLMLFVFTAFWTVVVDAAVDKGLTGDQSVNVVLGMTVTDTLGRFCLGYVTDAGLISKVGFATVCFVASGASFCLFAWLDGFGAIMALMCVAGVFYGGLMIIGVGIVFTYIEKDKMGMALASMLCSFAPMSALEPYFIGYFRDTLQSYNGLFNALALLCGVCALMNSATPALARYRDRRKKEQQVEGLQVETVA